MVLLFLEVKELVCAHAHDRTSNFVKATEPSLPKGIDARNGHDISVISNVNATLLGGGSLALVPMLGLLVDLVTPLATPPVIELDNFLVAAFS